MRTILLGDIGNRLDIADAEGEIERLRARRERDAYRVADNAGKLQALASELGRQKLALTALTRFLIAKGLVSEEELDEFIREVDAEDGSVDGMIPITDTNGRLRLKPGGLPGKKKG